MGTMNHLQSRIPPALVLLLLSPMIAELLSGSAPPLEFFNPIAFALLVSLYGSGAILMRELMVRWGKGYASLLLLGAAYGIIEEGLMVKSFFDPAWPDLGFLGIFGHWIGVNWVWAEMLTIYHAVFSITIPVLLVELAYPSLRKEHWVSNRTLGFFATLLVGVSFLGFFALTPYYPPVPHYTSAVLLVLLLIFLAWKVPPDYGMHGSKQLYRPIYFWAAGFLGTLAFFLIFWLLPFFLPFPVLMMLSGALLVSGFARFLKGFDWRGYNNLHRFALASGGLSLFILLALLQEIDKTRIDNPQGMGIVGLIFLSGLLLFWWRIRQRMRDRRTIMVWS
ncbi:MAG: hypothetical protein H3Z49_03815 [archaeon]|nr:hypothetical protein [archaeon]